MRYACSIFYMPIYCFITSKNHLPKHPHPGFLLRSKILFIIVSTVFDTYSLNLNSFSIMSFITVVNIATYFGAFPTNFS
jgi:hypothetical protein